MRKWHRAAAAIILLSSVGRANVRKTHKNFPCLKAKLRGKKCGSGAKPQPHFCFPTCRSARRVLYHKKTITLFCTPLSSKKGRFAPPVFSIKICVLTQTKSTQPGAFLLAVFARIAKERRRFTYIYGSCLSSGNRFMYAANSFVIFFSDLSGKNQRFIGCKGNFVADLFFIVYSDPSMLCGCRKRLCGGRQRRC